MGTALPLPPSHKNRISHPWITANHLRGPELALSPTSKSRKPRPHLDPMKRSWLLLRQGVLHSPDWRDRPGWRGLGTGGTRGTPEHDRVGGMIRPTLPRGLVRVTRQPRGSRVLRLLDLRRRVEQRSPTFRMGFASRVGLLLAAARGTR